MTSEDKDFSELSNLCKFLDTLISNVLEYQCPISSSRYGDHSFRNWLESIDQSVQFFLSSQISNNLLRAEIHEYFVKSLGSRERLDYGTGHELNFICFMYCLKLEGILQPDLYAFCVQEVFLRYWDLVRSVQKKFLLEPAGSLGVWGLDDYNYLPFLFGAAQLRNHKYLKPCSVLDPYLIEQYQSTYIYFKAIYNMSTDSEVHLRERSPILYDITCVKSWDKVYKGLFRMYENNVLRKLPVMQHFYFGEMIPFKHTGCDISEHLIHDHNGDCCGNRIPSIHSLSKASNSYKYPMD